MAAAWKQNQGHRGGSNRAYVIASSYVGPVGGSWVQVQGRAHGGGAAAHLPPLAPPMVVRKRIS